MKTEQLPFLFLHGAGGTQSKWRLLREKLQSTSHLYVDLPGRGAHPEANASTIGEYANSINKLISEDVIVVGHSMGGLIGIELALNNPHVKGLVLVASHFHLPVHPKILDSMKNGVFPNGLFYASYSKEADPLLLEQEKSEINFVSMERTHYDFNACNEYSTGNENISKLTIPLLGVYGEDDRMLPMDAADILLKVNSYAEVTTVGKCGHYIMVEQPQALLNILTQFRNKIAVLN